MYFRFQKLGKLAFKILGGILTSRGGPSEVILGPVKKTQEPIHPFFF